MVARDFWRKFEIIGKIPWFFASQLSSWLAMNCSSSLIFAKHHILWKILFPFAIWQLWLHRNRFIFNRGVVDPKFLEGCVGKGLEFAALVPDFLMKPACVTVPIKWQKPDLGWIKLNTNGAACSSLGSVGGGGLLRNSEGDWVGGFARSLGKCSSLISELWALNDGLVLAKQLGVLSILVEVNAEMVVDLLNNNCINLVVDPLLSDCRDLLREFSNPVVKHVFREANQCADAMAKLGLNLDVSFITFVNPPPVVVNLLAFDKAELYCNRLICV